MRRDGMLVCSVVAFMGGCGGFEGAVDEAGEALCDDGASAAPGSRPSELPEAMRWVDSQEPALDASTSPLVLRETLELPAFEGGGMADPVLTWSGAGWALVIREQLLPLDVAGHAVGAPRPVGPVGATGGAELGACRVGMARSDGRSGWLALAEDDGSPSSQAPAHYAARSADVSWLAAGRRWVLARALGDGADAWIALDALDEHGAPVGTGREVRAPGAERARVVALSSRVVVGWAARSGIELAALDWPSGEPHALRVMTANLWDRGGLELARLRDRVVVAASDASGVHVAVVEAFGEPEVVHGPTLVARSTARRMRPGLAASEERGFVVLCHATSDSPWGGDEAVDAVGVRLLGPDARPWGGELRLAEGGEPVVGVACGVSGSVILAVWTRADGSVGGARLALRQAVAGAPYRL